MPRLLFAIAAAALLAASGCTDHEAQAEATAIGAAAASGTIPGQLGSDWTSVTRLADAEPGGLVAQNAVTGECAYADGQGSYYIAGCV